MSSNALLWPSQGTIPEERLDKYKYLRLPSQGASDGNGPPLRGSFRIIVTFPPAADITFQFFRFYQINEGQAPGNETNVPMVIIDSLPAGSLEDLTNGFDIRVFDSAGSPIPYESIDINVNPDGSADIEIWLNMPSAKDFEFVQLAFGKAGATDDSTPDQVYDSQYVSVYHLNGVGTDSTINADNLTLTGTPAIAAKIGTGLDFAGTVTSFAIRNPYDSFPPNDITVEMWLQTTGDGDGIISYAVGGGALANHFILFSQEDFDVFIVNTISATGLSFNDGIFHHLVVTWRSSDGQTLVYDNGNLVFTGTQNSGGFFINNGALVLGQEQDSLGGGFQAPQSYNGILEEVKISKTVRSADAIKCTFNNQNDNNAFWFRTPILTVSETNVLVDELGNNIVTELIP